MKVWDEAMIAVLCLLLSVLLVVAGMALEGWNP